MRGDRLALEAVDGSVRRYRVADLAVRHASATWLLDASAGDRLVLLTCYPFDAVDPGTPWRYVITAYPGSGQRGGSTRYTAVQGTGRADRSMVYQSRSIS